jgi:anti-sigma factor RsiW
VSSSGSGSGEKRAERATAAEEHLGDRLAAFVDGELADDARERVQAHLATCPQCKAAATEQRRLKSVVAASELPAISPGLLARLQNLAACGPDGPDDRLGGPGAPGSAKDALRGVHELPGGRGGPFGGGALGSGAGGALGGPGRRRPSYLEPARGLVAPGEGRGARGFRIHEVARGLTGDTRSPLDSPPAAPPVPAAPAPSAGLAGFSRRFAFVAAGAFSMAAIAIGSALPMEAGVDGGAHPDDGPAVTPFSANSITTDTHGTTPEDLLDGRERRLMEQAGTAAAAPAALARARTAAVVSSVTAVPTGSYPQGLQASAGGASGGPMTAR